MNYEKFREKYDDIRDAFNDMTIEERVQTSVHCYYDQIKELMRLKDLLEMSHREQVTKINNRIKEIEKRMSYLWKKIESNEDA